jgi:hypothetical protein
MSTPFRNVLYLAVQPQISMNAEPGRVDQVLILVPTRDWASEFYPDEVSGYISMFQNRSEYFRGGHVEGYDIQTEPTDDGVRMVVRVTQYGS